VEGCAAALSVGTGGGLVFNSAQSTEPAAFQEEESKYGFGGCGTTGISQCLTTEKKKTS